MTPLRSLVALIALFVLPLAALATELDQFHAKVKKSAPFGNDVTPPVACVCKQQTGQVFNVAGQLHSEVLPFTTGHAVVVSCHVLFFNPQTEEFARFSQCDDWVLLPK